MYDEEAEVVQIKAMEKIVKVFMVKQITKEIFFACHAGTQFSTEQTPPCYYFQH
jgi:hypothetical protein